MTQGLLVLNASTSNLPVAEAMTPTKPCRDVDASQEVRPPAGWDLQLVAGIWHLEGNRPQGLAAAT